MALRGPPQEESKHQMTKDNKLKKLNQKLWVVFICEFITSSVKRFNEQF